MNLLLNKIHNYIKTVEVFNTIALQFYCLFLAFFFLSIHYINAQTFPPAAGFDGSTAIHKDSLVFIDWATEVTINRGYKDIAIPRNGQVDYGISDNAIGKVEAIPKIVSLGDGGTAILSFNYPIVNGKGADFAVFENAFFKNDTSEDAFLEFAFVEVSTNGIEYLRFPAVSEIQTDTQIGSFSFLNARYVHNLAGKYTSTYGTPFDLDELQELSLDTSINLMEINFIKIIDVIGSLDENYATYDSNNIKINDPYPTDFISGGFDLDAVGVINNLTNASNQKINIYPNPATNNLNFTIRNENIDKSSIFSIYGKLLLSSNQRNNIDVSHLKDGIYIIQLHYSDKQTSQLFIKGHL